MPRSMTAFERCEERTDRGELAWEIRSVNHRYLDLQVRLPEDLRGLEPAVRERVGGRLARGKVECSLRYVPVAAERAVEVDWSYLDQLLEAARGVDVRLHGAAPIPATELLRFPGVLIEAPRDLGPVREAALALLDRTLDGFVAAREREGDRLDALLRERLDAVERTVDEVRRNLPAVESRNRERLEARLAELGQPADAARLEQEMVYQAQRLDASEELDRLAAHCDEIRAILQRDEPVGRRLDFLMQELNREANTLGSKAGGLETTSGSVELKVLIEQMREQIQNLE